MKLILTQEDMIPEYIGRVGLSELDIKHFKPSVQKIILMVERVTFQHGDERKNFKAPTRNIKGVSNVKENGPLGFEAGD